MYPDGVTLYVYKGDEPIGRYKIDTKTDKEEVVEESLKDIHVDVRLERQEFYRAFL